MKIANPIYDIVFKYLMEDERIARTILSALLKVDVVAVEVRPHEYSDDNRDALSVFRIDFGATIRDADGKKNEVVIIVKKIRLISEPSLFIITIIGQFHKITKCIDITGLTLDRILHDRFYKVLNLFHQMYQIDDDKHILTQLETLYSQDEDLYHVLQTLDCLKNNKVVLEEMSKEDNYILSPNRSSIIEFYDAKYMEQESMLRSAIKLLLKSGWAPGQIATNLNISNETVDSLMK
ncbi:MAG: hypothetical protein II404_08985 [Prevotella sp.]|nr:hypothetical protein [Prevotella sp.]